jgi:protein required for attachment to host cells
LQKTNACIIVADGGRARLFVAADDDRAQAGVSLVNADHRARGADTPGRTKSERVTNRQAGDVHPIDARRDQHRLELERRFAREIAEHAAQLTRGWSHGSVMLVAEPRLLGLVREPLYKALNPSLELKELAKDYSHLAAADLRGHLELHRMIPAHGSGVQ